MGISAATVIQKKRVQMFMLKVELFEWRAITSGVSPV